MTDQEIETVFGLKMKMSIANFHLFDEKGKIQKYKCVDEILKKFFKLRLECYQKRKDYMMDQLNKDWKKLQNKVRFVTEVVAEQLVVRNRKKKELTAELLKRGYDRFPDEKKTNKKKKKDNDDDEEDQSEAEEKTETTSKKPPSKVVVSQDKIKMDNLDKDYDYLLSMKIWSLTAEYIELLKKKLAEKKEELDNLASRTPRDMWEEDLDYFMELWDVFEKDLNEFENNVGKIGKKRIKMPTQQANARAKAKERALQRAKDRENGKEEMSVDRASEEESVSVVKKDTSRTRSKTLGSKTQGPKSLPVKSNTTHTKVTLKKKDEIQNKKGTRTLHDYFSMETSNSTSGGSPKKNSKSKKEKSVSEKSKKPPAKKTELSKSQVAATKDKNKKPPAKRTQSKRKSESSEYTDGKTLRSDKSEVTTQNKTKRSESDSVYDSKDGGDSGDDAESESSSITDDSDLSSRTPKKPVTRKNAKQPGKKPINSDSDDD
jgi:DNA topoisomerase-2